METEYKKVIESLCEENSDVVLSKRGEFLAENLGLKLNRNNKYLTSYGEKTARGLYLTVLNLLSESSKIKGE